MGQVGGYLLHDRAEHALRGVAERVRDFDDIVLMPTDEVRREQAGRCMNCGVGFCQAGIAFGSTKHVTGCPLHNRIPEWNDLLWRGLWEEAYERLALTNPFPEFTGYVCPALCEKACNLALHEGATTIRDNERAIIEHAYAQGYVKAPTAKEKSGKTVCVVGSGPAGLACAWELAKAGHEVTLIDRAQRPGGLLMHGIPTMKLPKNVVERRVGLLEQAGVHIKLGQAATSDLASSYDAVIVACGAQQARELHVPGAESQGVHLALEYLGAGLDAVLAGKAQSAISAEGKHVVVIGGGDTGTDCLAMAVRQGAKSATQLQYHPAPTHRRSADNPWPTWPEVFTTDYGQAEAAELDGRDDARLWSTDTLEVIADESGHARQLRVTEVEWSQGKPVPVSGTERLIPADMVLVARGFAGPELAAFDALGTPLAEGPRPRPVTREGEKFRLQAAENVFVAGDARNGATLVVTAIADGLACAKAVDAYLGA